MKPILSHPVRFADLPQRKPTVVRLVPDAGALEDLADRLGVDAFRKVRLDLELTPGPGRDWTLSGKLGATVVQPCRVTTDPVTTRIEDAVARHYTPDLQTPEGEEVEMDDDTLEPLPSVLDLGEVLEEALALAIPEFPRSKAADDLNMTAAPEGAQPLTDEAIKPFAGLAALRAKMDGDD
ncbi:YceD family protein [Jannaschia donghaensis]|uniref:DUF177 domain-containing protein n=1 Tax=Jannaschia donghaensis TaxID=420998 RepID=A0A0M6YKG0_9RHOB|nr:DUF177 domain-containing protein [Jannaschia donghaensis]CTQ50299.1 hypothetical protein JDO7802_02320 [Jannaschia donghaensis]